MKNKKKILLIDDDDINNYIAEEWARSNYQHQVDLVIFADAVEALQFLVQCDEEDFPVLILCDLKMPLVDGFEFIENYEQKFLDKHPHTKIVVLSSSIRQDDMAKVKDYSSVADFVSKLSIQENFKQIFEQHLHIHAN